jgi:hypothetical protein
VVVVAVVVLVVCGYVCAVPRSCSADSEIAYCEFAAYNDPKQGSFLAVFQGDMKIDYFRCCGPCASRFHLNCLQFSETEIVVA